MGFPFDADGSQGNDTGPKPIPEGDYEFRVVEVPKHSVTATNRNMLTMKLVIEDGEFSGRSIRFNLVFIPKDQPSHSMTIKALKAFGLESDGQLNIEPEDFVDKIVRAHVKVTPEKYIPKGQNKPVTVNKSEIGWFIFSESEGSQVSSTKKEEDEVPF